MRDRKNLQAGARGSSGQFQSPSSLQFGCRCPAPSSHTFTKIVAPSAPHARHILVRGSRGRMPQPGPFCACLSAGRCCLLTCPYPSQLQPPPPPLSDPVDQAMHLLPMLLLPAHLLPVPLPLLLPLPLPLLLPLSLLLPLLLVLLHLHHARHQHLQLLHLCLQRAQRGLHDRTHSTGRRAVSITVSHCPILHLSSHMLR